MIYVPDDIPDAPSHKPPRTSTSILRPVDSTASIFIGSGNYITSSSITVHSYPIEAWAEPILPEPKLDAIKCPGCGQGSVKKTNIDGIVECAYCGRQFTLRY